VIPRPSADYFVVGRRQKTKKPNSFSYHVGPKLTSSIPSLAKTDFLHYKSGQLGQNRLPPFQAIPVRLKPTFHLSHSSLGNIVNKFSFLFLPCHSWSPNYPVLVVLPEATTSLLGSRSCESRLIERYVTIYRKYIIAQLLQSSHPFFLPNICI
jgi:hypothetical protein